MRKLKANEAIEWVRLPELMMRTGALGTTSRPVLFDDGADRGDIFQGRLDDCWLLSSLASLSWSGGAVEKLFGAAPTESPDGRYELVFFNGLSAAS